MDAHPNPVDDDDLPGLSLQIEQLARAAGALIMLVYATDFEVHDKTDRSPVTIADEQAEALIVQGLREIGGPWPVVAEEAAARGEWVEPADCFWLVDPLDGTREFIARNGEFTVNIALVRHGIPVLGVVHLPVPDQLYLGVPGQGAWLHGVGGRRRIRCRAVPPTGSVAACSRSHGDGAVLADWLAREGVVARVPAGSSLKFGLLAAGRADVYARFGRTMEWDTAAGHAVLAAAGGSVCDTAGRPLRYGKPGYENPHFIARGAAAPSRGDRTG